MKRILLVISLICIYLLPTEVYGQVKKKPRKKSTPPPVVARCSRFKDSSEIASIFNSMNGPEWFTKWDLSAPIESWQGVTVNKSGCVSQIVISNNNLSGNIPALNLPALVQLMMEDKNISGSLPLWINLPNLKSLIIKSDQISGLLVNIDKCPHLEYLDIASPKMTGTIPNFDKIPDLTDLYLSGDFSGSIPDFAKLTKLQTLEISGSHLSGKLPELKNQATLKIGRAHV